jgi:calcineurin-like phosphoesterase family protein
VKFSQHLTYRKRFCRNTHVVEPVKDNVWVIGDVHGCADEFEEICERIYQRTPNAKIIQLGDLIDRGPHFLEVFNVVEKYDVDICIGNHELNFLLEHYGFKKCNSKPRQKSHEIFAVLNQDDRERILTTLNRSKNFICIMFDEGDDTFMPMECWFLSHSPIKQFEEIDVREEIMTNGWTYCGRNAPYDQSKLYPEDYFVHGHQHWNYTDIEDQIEEFKRAERNSMNIDGGCVYGDQLIAYNICKNDFIKVKSKTTHFKY